MNESRKPTPWYLEALPAHYQVVGVHDHASERLTAIRQLNLHRFEALSIGTKTGQVCIVPLDESNQETAEFIVRACNAHDDTLSALKELHQLLTDNNLTYPLSDQGIRARAAITKAENTNGSIT